MKIATRATAVCRIIQLSDTHIAADSASRFDGVDTYRSLQAVLALLAEQDHAADLVLITGDLAYDPAPAAYKKLNDLLQTVDLPIACLPGNHDAPAMMAAGLSAKHIDCGKQFSLNNWSVLLLNTHQPGRHAGRLSAAELQFLRDALRDNTDAHVLLALHHHVLPCGSPWMDAMMLENAAALLAIVHRYQSVKALVWGHIHQVFEQHDGQRLYLGSPSTCAQFKPHTERHETDPLAPGYRLLELHADGTIKTTVRRLASHGYPNDHSPPSKP